MILRRFFAFLLLLSFFATAAFAQEDVLRPKGKPGSDGDDGGSYRKSKKIPIMLGLELGMNYNMFSQNLSWNLPSPNTPYAAFESGSGFSGFMGVLADVSISKNSGIQLKLIYDQVYYKNTLDGESECLSGILLTDEVAEWDYDITGAYMDISILYRYNFNNNLVFMVGPVWRNPIGDHTLDRTFTWITGNCYFDIPQQKQIHISSSGATDPQFGIDLGVGYKLALSKKMWLVPQARFQYFFTPTSDDYTLFADDNSHVYTNQGPSDVSFSDPMLHSLKLSAALWFEL